MLQSSQCGFLFITGRSSWLKPKQVTRTHLTVIKACFTPADLVYHSFRDRLFFAPFHKKKKNTQKTTTNLNSVTVNPELQMDNSVRFCKGFCDQLRKEKERREGKKKPTTTRSVKNHQSAEAIISGSLWVIRIESVNKEAVVQKHEFSSSCKRRNPFTLTASVIATQEIKSRVRNSKILKIKDN